MKLIPNSTARHKTRMAPARSAGSPQIPFPVIRIAPQPNRVTRRSFPIMNSPALPASSCPCCVSGLLFRILFFPSTTKLKFNGRNLLTCGQDHAETRFPLHHARVSFSSLLERNRFDHRADILQDAEGKGVLAI